MDNSSGFMVMTEESNLQAVDGKFRATQGWLGRRASVIDGLGSWMLCGRNLVNGSLGPLPPDSAISPYSPASALTVSFFILPFFFFLLFPCSLLVLRGLLKMQQEGRMWG